MRYGGRPNSILSHDGSNITIRDVLAGQVRLESSRVLSATYCCGLRYGLYVENSHLVVSDTLFAYNDYYPLYVTGGSTVITLTANTFSGNSTDRVAIDTGSAAGWNGATLTPQTGLEGYVLWSDLSVPAGVTLTVQPGVTVMGRDDTELQVLGHLAAVGTPAQPITFTSSTDSGPEEWSGLVFDGGTGELRHVTVRYGGRPNSVLSHDGSDITVRDVLAGQVRIESSRVLSATYCCGSRYALYVENSHLAVDDTLFAYNGSYSGDNALYAAGASTVITLTGSTFQNNSGTGVRVNNGQASLKHATLADNGDDGIRLSGGTGFVHCSEIRGNGGYGLRNDTGITVDARYNWWGSSTGPTHVSNPGGTGDAVSDDVVFDPWLEEPACATDLQLRKTVTPGIVAPGQAITYTLIYTNDGPGFASSVLITDEVPITLTGVSFTSSGAQITPTGSVHYAWQVEPLSPEAGGVITVAGIVHPSVSGVFSLTNRATIRSTEVCYLDENLDDNTSVVSNTVDAEPPVAPALVSPPDGAVIGDTTPTLTWQASPSPDVAGYVLDWNGMVMDVGKASQYTTAVLAEDDYTWTVAAYDTVRNTSAYTDVWSFTVATALPEIVATAPASGTVDVEISAPLVITFSRTIDAGTFSFTALPDPGGWAESWNGAGTVVTLSHTAFTAGTVHTITVTAADDLEGHPLSGAPYAWRFATAPHRVYLPLVTKPSMGR